MTALAVMTLSRLFENGITDFIFNRKKGSNAGYAGHAIYAGGGGGGGDRGKCGGRGKDKGGHRG